MIKRVTIQAGDDLKPGEPVYIKADGKAYRCKPSKSVLDAVLASDGVWRVPDEKEMESGPDGFDVEFLVRHFGEANVRKYLFED